MISKVTMPKLGQTMEKATVEKWVKTEGDKVAKGDVLLEITTDKATLEVESYWEGTLLKIFAEEGVEVPVNHVIAVLGDPGDEIPDDIAAPPPAPAEEAPRPKAAPSAPRSAPTPGAAPPPPPALAPTAPSPAPAPAVALMPERVFASPRAKRRSKEERVALECLTGSGPNGRIIERDVEAYLERTAAVRITPTAREIAFRRGVDILKVKGSGTSDRIMKEDVARAVPARGERIELTAMRRVIADRLSYSFREVPHFYLMMDMDMTKVIPFRKKLNDEGEVRISFNDILMRACVLAFEDVPGMNSAWLGDAILRRADVNIGLAVSLDGGLIVPVVKCVQMKTLAQIAVESADLVKRARGKKLNPDEFEGGCLTISNLGMFDVDAFVPIINPGESAILGIGRIAEKPVVIHGGIQVRSMMTVTLSGDHRTIDGAQAATFLKKIKDALAEPELLLE
ncbi:MAG: 2-oxo acid dehydrogenase subunit E2 [Planctomycetes bacterium]|nr:2-oxo acid dehydrogenase subunit E2 [Planctomycetota bacterium]